MPCVARICIYLSSVARPLCRLLVMINLYISTSYAYAIQHRERIILEHSHPIGKAIVFEAEVAAISTGVRAITPPYISRVVVYGDSTSALSSAINPPPHPPQSQSLLLNQIQRTWLDSNVNRTVAFK